MWGKRKESQKRTPRPKHYCYACDRRVHAIHPEDDICTECSIELRRKAHGLR